MIYVFDTSSLRALQHFYPGVFKSIWAGLNALVGNGELISTREVWKESRQRERQRRCEGMDKAP